MGKLFSFTFNKELKEAWGNDREVTLINQRIIQKKAILKKLFTLYYREIISFLKFGGPTVEIGSGGGFFKELYPKTISSDILLIPGIDIAIDALKMPLKDQSVRNIILRGVLHHINNPFVFFRECERVLQREGRIIISDPYVSFFSYFLYKYLHFENCNYSWQLEFKKGQPLMDCNLALTTIIFKRRKEYFLNTFPGLKIIYTNYHTFLIYLLTGGYSYPALIPNSFFNIVMVLEKFLRPFRKLLASVIFIVIEKK